MERENAMSTTVVGDALAGVRPDGGRGEIEFRDIGNGFQGGEMEEDGEVRKFVALRVVPFSEGMPIGDCYESLWLTPQALELFILAALKVAKAQWPGYFVEQVKR
jgi:hypothetical protein